MDLIKKLQRVARTFSSSCLRVVFVDVYPIEAYFFNVACGDSPGAVGGRDTVTGLRWTDTNCRCRGHISVSNNPYSINSQPSVTEQESPTELNPVTSHAG